jgi:hypothetical protein
VNACLKRIPVDKESSHFRKSIPAFRHFYIGELKPGGSLTELSGLVETQLKGTDLYVGEASQDSLADPLRLERDAKFRANVGFLLMQPLAANIITNILSQRKAPSAIISFESSLSADDMFLTLHSVDRSEFLDLFKKEADFIGYFVLQPARAG